MSEETLNPEGLRLRKIRDIVTPQRIYDVSTSIIPLRSNPAHVLVCGDCSMLIIIDTDSGSIIRDYSGRHGGYSRESVITCAAESPIDSAIIYSGASDGHILMHDCESGGGTIHPKAFFVFKEDDQDSCEVQSIAVSENGQLLVAGNERGNIALLDAKKSLTLLKQISASQDWICTLEFIGNDSILCSTGDTWSLLLDLDLEVNTRFRFGDWCFWSDLSSDRRLVATAGDGKQKLRVFDAVSGDRATGDFEPVSKHPIMYVRFVSPHRLLTIGGNSVQIWDLVTRKRVVEVEVNSCFGVLSRDRRRLFLGDNDDARLSVFEIEFC